MGYRRVYHRVGEHIYERLFEIDIRDKLHCGLGYPGSDGYSSIGSERFQDTRRDRSQ